MAEGLSGFPSYRLSGIFGGMAGGSKVVDILRLKRRGVYTGGGKGSHWKVY